MTWRFGIAAFVILLGTSLLHAEEVKICPFDNSFASPQPLYGYIVQINPNPKDDPGHPCTLTIKTATGAPVLTATEQGIGWVSASADKDFDGDGKPDLLFEGWTGGAHCCFRYWLITSDGPKVWEFFDYDPLVVEQRAGAKVASFRAWDGGFDYFESSFAGSPSPQILFSIEKNRVNMLTVQDATLCSPNLPEELTSEAIQRFRSTARPAKDEKGLPPSLGGLDTDDPDTMRAILKFVIQRIYCGNEKQGLENLRQMWPDFDYSRIRKEILKTYTKEGVVWRIQGTTPMQPPVVRLVWTGKDQ